MDTTDSITVPASDLRWLLDSYLELLDGGSLPDRHEATVNRLRTLLMTHSIGSTVRQAASGDDEMYLLSRVQDDDSVPLYVFHDRALADQAQRLLQRGTGMVFDVLPIPVEG